MERPVQRIYTSQPTVEGAGVYLHRAIGLGRPETFDPFLLLDDFRSDDPEQYQAGFPWHPHRGMETITYMLRGTVEHGDSLGNRDVIAPGAVQWMTAGSGIIHQEMPKGDPAGAMYGFQLWANLPAAKKMMPPRYRGISSGSIPSVKDEGGGTVRVIAGIVGGVTGPVSDVVTSPEYLDVSLPPGARFVHPTLRGHTAFAYVFEGVAHVGDRRAGDRHLVHFGDGDRVSVRAGDEGARFILVSGKPIGEPIAWEGPIVMNTQEELRVAFEELERGDFIKDR